MDENTKSQKIKLWKIILPAILIILVAFTIYMGTLTYWMEKVETRLLCQSIFCPGTTGTVRVITLNHDGLKPVKDAGVDISIKIKDKKYDFFRGKTGEEGTLDASFEIPADIPQGEGELIVKVNSSKGKDEIVEKIQILRSYKIYLTTDKPVYQPGQTIHIRSLSMLSETLTPPGGQPAILEVEDGKGNKVFKTMDKETSDYGIVSADFILAREAEPGDYRIRAIIGGDETEVTVQVKKYVLPKFEITFTPDKRFYRPGEVVKGEVRADYFFGKPVSEGNVKVEMASYDVEFNKFAEIEGVTDKDGYFEFEESLENYLTGQPLENGKAMVRFAVEVTDKAEHKEIIYHTLYVSENTIQTTLIPESGEIVPGIENIIYLVTSYPDGSPARADLTLEIGQDKVDLQTDSTGIAEFTLKPEWFGMNILIKGQDGFGNYCELNYTPLSNLVYDALLLRTDRAVYSEGDTAEIEVLSAGSGGTIFLDVVKNHQTRLTKTLLLEDKKASMELPLTHDLLGTIQINVYKLLSDGNFTRDTQTLYVETSKDLSLEISKDKDTYLPGKKGDVEIEVKDKEGRPVAAALGISVVDESVFSLSEREPGLEKVYFTLEEELMKPQYEICRHYIEVIQANLLKEKSEEEVKKEEEAAKVAFCSLPPDSYGIIVNTYPKRLAEILQSQKKYFYYLENLGLWGVMLIIILTPLGLLGITFYNNILKGKDKNRFLVINNENLVAVIVYLIGFFLIMISPFLLGIIIAILSEILDFYYGTRETLTLLIPVIITILASIYYIILLRKNSRNDSIKALNTLKYSFLLVQLFMIGIMVFAFILLTAFLLPYLDFDDIFSRGEAILAIAAIATLLMPFILTYNTISHLTRPKEGSPWKSTAAWGCIGVTGIAGLILVFAFLLPAALYKSGASPVMDNMVMNERSMSGGFTQTVDEVSISYEKEALFEGDGEVKKDGLASGGETSSEEAPTYLRQYFPETMYFNPELITDEEGRATVALQMADSITTWRMGVSASSLKGEIGGEDCPLRVFQDFFIDIDLPINLTEGDEVFIPVAVYNYLSTEQEINLRAEKGDWFDFLEKSEQKLSLQANDVSVVYYPIKIKDTGKKKFTVYGKTEEMTDAISREVTIIPDGKEFRLCENGWLKEEVSHNLNIPDKAIDKSYDLWVKVYPAMFSQLVEGLDSMLHMPYG